MWNLVCGIVSLAVAGSLAAAAFVFIDLGAVSRWQASASAQAGFSALLSAGRAYATSVGEPLAAVADVRSVGVSPPPGFSGLAWSVSSGRLCLSGTVGKAVADGLVEAAAGMPDGYRVAGTCDGAGALPAAFPAFVAASVAVPK